MKWDDFYANPYTGALHACPQVEQARVVQAHS
jgi:hypothetical protein